MMVSFIIPAYNAADTIVRCLESIRNLTLEKEDYEIIVIDDASIDDTVSIIGNWKESFRKDKKLENGDCRLEILRQPENHRQGAARNRGVKAAKGEYICFVDADDAVTEGIVKAIRLAKEKETDMVPYHLAYANENGAITKEEIHLSFIEGQIFTGIEMQNKHPYWLSGPVAYIYSRAFLERVDYPFAEGVLYEDSDFVAVHLYHARRMMYSSELGYVAYYRDGSTTHSMNHSNCADYLLLGMRMLKLYDLAKDKEAQFAQSILEGACFNVAISCKRLIKLSNLKDVKAYYARIDERVNRKAICNNKSLHMYYWKLWTSVCMRHKKLAMILLGVLIPMYKLVKR